MDVSLTPELMTFVDEKVRSGRYADASQVVTEALCLLKRSDEMRSTNRARIEKASSDGAAAGPAAVPPVTPVAPQAPQPKSTSPRP